MDNFEKSKSLREAEAKLLRASGYEYGLFTAWKYVFRNKMNSEIENDLLQMWQEAVTNSKKAFKDYERFLDMQIKHKEV